MIKINEAIIVEGNYDKARLANIVDATIIVTDGFMIFKDTKKAEMIKKLADTCGVIIFTDSDAAGFKIRNYLKNILNGKKVKHAYIPDIKGKERRKNHHSKEGFLGVEGVSDDIIITALNNAGYSAVNEDKKRLITKTDLYSDGLCGGDDSAQRREKFKKNLNLPKHLSANSLLDVLNRLYSYDEYRRFVDNLDE